jgi:hypothetical protein
MNIKRTLLFFMSLNLVVLAGLRLTAAETTKKHMAVKIKPDIVLKNLEITPLSVLGDGSHRIQIKAVVYNPVAQSSTGPFKVKAVTGAADSPVHIILAEENVAGLANTGATVRPPSATVLFFDTVPIGRTIHYQVTADSLNAVAEQKEDNNLQEGDYRVSSGITDGGGDEAVISGVDLVVSQVEVTRGMFAGREKIQIIASIRNMWHGGTAQRIKVLYTGPGVSFAVWIEGGIGGDETKRAGAIYIECDSALVLPLNFSVVVDNNNEIVETNDANNRCEGIRFAAGDTHVVHECPISGPHEPLI